MTHVYSLGHLLGRSGCADLVDHGIKALRGGFLDTTEGGWFAKAGPAPTTTGKSAYEHAFVVLAGASATAAQRPGGRELLDEALAVFLGHFWDDESGMVVEEWDQTWSSLDGYRGANANMHAVEALLSAADVLGDSSLRARALRITTRIVHDLAAGNEWRIPEHFDDTWTPLPDYNVDDPAHPFRPYGATVGHWLEWSRLALHLRAGLGDAAPDWLLADARALFEAAVLAGWAVDGADGFLYTVGWDGRPVVRERMHWVVAEAVGAAAALHAATGESSYADWYATWWAHIESAFIDRQRGSWHHELSSSLEPSSTIWHGKPDLYHSFQATLIPRLPLGPTLAQALAEVRLAG
jgi:sulfoquinovose isomerase